MDKENKIRKNTYMNYIYTKTGISLKATCSTIPVKFEFLNLYRLLMKKKIRKNAKAGVMAANFLDRLAETECFPVEGGNKNAIWKPYTNLPKVTTLASREMKRYNKCLVLL